MRGRSGIAGVALLGILCALCPVARGGAGAGNGGGGQTFSGGRTDENGRVILRIHGQDFPFRFIDETLGVPVSGLSVGVGHDPNVPGLGVMLVVDPFEDYPVQVVLLYEEPAGPSHSPGPLSVQSHPSVDPNDANAALAETIRLLKVNGRLIKALTLHFYISDAAQASFKKLDISLQVMYLIANVAKWLDKGGLVPAGEWAGAVGTTEILTKQEAVAQLSASWETAQVERAFFFSGSILTGVFFPPAGAAGVLPSALTTAIGAVVDPLTALLDFHTLVSCEDKIVVTSLGTARFYACYTAPQAHYTWPTKPDLCITVNDPNGGAARWYEYELINRKNPAESYVGFLDDREACLQVPAGDYWLRVFARDSRSSMIQVSVPEKGTSLTVTLPERAAGTADLFVKEIYAGGGIEDLQTTTDPDGNDSGYGCLYTYTISGLSARLTIYRGQQEGPWMMVLGSLTGTGEKRYVPREDDPDYCWRWVEPRAPFTCTGTDEPPGEPIDIELEVRGKVSDMLPGLPVDVTPDESGGVRARLTDVRLVENGQKMTGTLVFESFPFENVRRENVTLVRQGRRFVTAEELIQQTMQFVGMSP